jgi:antitoxin component HigA of HigAB toxin-antitoxin module
MVISQINTAEDYKLALCEIERLMDTREKN